MHLFCPATVTRCPVFITKSHRVTVESDTTRILLYTLYIHDTTSGSELFGGLAIGLFSSAAYEGLVNAAGVKGL